MLTETYTQDHVIELLQAIHHDQSGLAKALEKIKRIVSGYYWIAEGAQGCYSYDDERFRDEFGNCLDEIIDTIDKELSRTSRAHQLCCGKYRHINFEDRTSVQMRFNFMDAKEATDYADFVEDVLMCATLVKDE